MNVLLTCLPVSHVWLMPLEVNRELDPLELELQMVVNHMRVLGIKLRPFARTCAIAKFS